jgi:radical SAM superfamily enzyme YgiQ (UPF0313 family)
MLGYPGEEKSDIKETINHLQLSDPSFYTITVAYPITGTPLYDEVTNTLSSEGDWQKRTDREYDFKRKHSKEFYQYAIDWVYNEVHYKKTTSLFRKVKHKSRSYVAQAMMFLS